MNLVLVWVRKSDEAEIRAAFGRAINMRKLSPQAMELADTCFFDTLVPASIVPVRAQSTTRCRLAADAVAMALPSRPSAAHRRRSSRRYA